MVYYEETTMKRKYWLILSFILAAVMTPSLSNATCTLNGVVIRVTAYDDLYTTIGGYIYFRTSSLSPYYYYVSTNDDDMVSNAIAYMNSGRTATFQGNVAACPAVPVAGGAAFIGALNYLYNP
jgi:hypothetical protein